MRQSVFFPFIKTRTGERIAALVCGLVRNDEIWGTMRRCVDVASDVTVTGKVKGMRLQGAEIGQGIAPRGRGEWGKGMRPEGAEIGQEIAPMRRGDFLGWRWRWALI